MSQWRRKPLAGSFILNLIFVWLAAIFSGRVFALDPDKPITQYIQNVWQTEQGLPQNYVVAIVQIFVVGSHYVKNSR